MGCIVREILFEATGQPQCMVAVKGKAGGRMQSSRCEHACNLERNEEASRRRLKRGPTVLV